MFGFDLTILAFVGLVALAACAVVYTLLFDKVSNERTQERRIKTIQARESTADGRKMASARVADAAKRRQTLQSSLEELEEKNKINDPNKAGLKDRLKQAGLSVSARTFHIISGGVGLFLAAMVFMTGANPLLCLAAGIVGGLGLPRWIVGFLRKRRLGAFTEEFPNAVDVIVRGVKAGLPLNDCMGIVAAEARDPVGFEFRKIMETQKMGVPMTEAIKKLYKNVPLQEANFFGIVIAIQQGAGGNLSEALANLSSVLRERKQMKLKIKAMAMEAKASAYIIGALPPIVAFLVYLSSPGYIMTLFTHPTGHMILGASAIWMTIGCFVMKQMINFDY